MTPAVLDKSATVRQSAHKRFRDFCDESFGIYTEEYFIEMLTFERKRSERSRRPFLLVKVNIAGISDIQERHEAAGGVLSALSLLNRETDLKGWYRHGTVIGVIVTEATISDPEELQERISDSLYEHLPEELVRHAYVSCHTFPDTVARQTASGPVDFTFYQDYLRQDHSRKSSLRLKRLIDIVGSLTAIILFSPFLLLIPALIKLTSPGPALFHQTRVGQKGKHFTFLKFRSMHANNNAEVHKQFVHSLIANGSAKNAGQAVFKMTNDKRITPFGAFLRKTSLDELPQLFNVLKGDMSLTGPRPPIPYEIEKYEVWHRRRVLEVKPGITGLWQVVGRSSTTFDDMVRMDIEYAKNWSLWLDIKILVKTPFAVFAGKGAY